MKRLATILSVLSLALVSLQAHAAGSVGDAGAGKAIAEQVCVSCHVLDGNSQTPQFPRIGGQYSTYLVKSINDYKTGQRNNPIMNGIVASMSQEDIENVSAYYAQQKGDLHVKQVPNF